jgi:hypothetical protein
MAQLLPETLVIDAFCSRRHEELLETLSAARATTEQILRELPRALRIVRIQATIGAGAETATCQMLHEVTGATWYAETLDGVTHFWATRDELRLRGSSTLAPTAAGGE